MNDARQIIDRFLPEVDYEKLSQGVCAGFESCYELMKSNAALGNFQTGIPQWSHLIRTYVEYGLTSASIAEMNYEFRPNNARNCWHVRYHKNGAAWTSHFVGGANNKRSKARKAIYKSELANRMSDLFLDDSMRPDANLDYSYFQLLHAGYTKSPDSITLVIPSRDQSTIVAATSLPIVKPSVAMVEEVEEAMHIELISINGEGQDAEKTDSAS